MGSCRLEEAYILLLHGCMAIIYFEEFQAVWIDAEIYISGRTVTMLGYDELGHIELAVFCGELGIVLIIAVDKHDDVGILLDGAGISKVGELRSVAVAGFDSARELRQCDDRNIEFFSQSLETSGDFRDLLDGAVVIPFGSHQLEVVNNKES